MWKTAITDQCGIELPLVSAGMGFVSRAPLAAAVSESGGLGLLGVAPLPPPAMREMLREVRRLTSRPFGVSLVIDQTAFGPATTDAHVDLCAEEQVPVVQFFWDLPPAAWLATLRAAGCRVWLQVGSLEAVRRALDLGVDAVVVQGGEAGGHSRATAGLLALLPRAVDVAGSVPVVAAGGIADGRGVAAAFALGASAVLVGTRLVASAEAWAHDEYKRRIVAADVDDVARTRIFGPEWPDQPMRVLRNRAVAEAEAGTAVERTEPIGTTLVMGAPYPMPPRSAVLPTPDTEGDFEQMCLAAGESTGLVAAVEPAGVIVRRMMAEARRVLGGAA